jgi:RNA processing factor Prp31
MGDVNKIFEMANEVENLVYNRGLDEVDKLVLFKFLYFNHFKLLGERNNLSKSELKELNDMIETFVKSLTYLYEVIVSNMEGEYNG